MRWGKSIALLFGLVLLLAWRAGSAAQSEQAANQASADAPIQRILILGDSLSAEYGLARGSGWVTLVEQRLAHRNQAYQIRNASISGDTTISGLQRLPSILKEFDADILVLQLGANDGLRGLPIPEMKNNLQKMVELAHSHGAQVLLVGQHIPPNYGQRYTQAFHNAYADVAKNTGGELVPFMLEGIATDTSLFQADGLHPTEQAQPTIADTIWQHLEPMLPPMVGQAPDHPPVNSDSAG